MDIMRIFNWDYKDLRPVEQATSRTIERKESCFDKEANEALKKILDQFLATGECKYRVTPDADLKGINIEIDTIPEAILRERNK